MIPALLLLPAGMLAGSFVTVIAHRVPRHEQFVVGRSRCPSCGTQIAAYDNVPVLSWLALRGRCRACKSSISARYPLAELGLGVLWAVTYLVVGDENLTELALGLVLCAVLVAVTLTDLEQRLIPNRIVLAGAIAALAIMLTHPSSLVEHGVAAIAAGGFLLVVALLYPRGMGMGDVKLVAVMGLFLGRAVAPAMVIGFAAGALVGIVMLARHGSAARKQAIPFGPFLALGGIVALWVGDVIVDWYLDSFFSS